MSRSALLVAFVALLLAPALATAQTTEPVGTESDDETTVSRAYDNPAALTDGLFGVYAFGFIDESESQAAGTLRTVPRIFAAGLTSELEDGEFVLEDPIEVPGTPIGDDSTVTRMGFIMFGTFDGEVVLLAVRQGTWVQVLAGIGAGNVDVQAELEAIATTLQPRWPSDSPIAVRTDGLRTGGIWDMMPMPEDMPAGFELDPVAEEGPAATVSVTVPVPPAPTGQQPGPTPEATIRDIPLFPTPTPADMPPAETETPATLPTPTPSTPVEDVATPAPNPRLAMPFDVTVEIFLPLEMTTISEEDGSCIGTGLLDGLATDGSLMLVGAQAPASAATAPLTGPGVVAYDTEAGQEICYFSAVFTDVPPRAAYTLLADESVIGWYTYDELSGADRVLVELGGE